MNRRLLSLLLASAAALAVLAAPAAARPPAGDWTLLRKDAFWHYACKVADRSKGGQWRIRTATWINHDESARRHRIGAWVALTRGSNRNIVADRTDTDWRGAYIQLALRGARDGDRVWAQGSYYGPVEPWSDGTRVSAITRCAKRAR